MTVLYRNTRALRVRFLQLLFWAGTFGFVSLALLAYGNGPHPDSWVVGAILAAIFAFCALGMEWYLRCYVTALHASQDELLLETLSTFGRARTRLSWSDVELAGERHDISNPYDAPSVDNVASLLRVRGRGLLIIDTTEDALDGASLRRLFRDAREAAQSQPRPRRS